MTVPNQEIQFIFDPYTEHGLDCEVRLVIYDNVKTEFIKIVELNAREKIKFYLTDLGEHCDFKYKYQVKEQLKWTDNISYKYLMPEQVTKEGIKYLTYPNKESSKLVVVFQAINKNPGYNYVRTLKDIPVSRLYIKDDYGADELTRSSYYLGPNKDFFIADNVISLIEKIRKELGIKKEDVICVGSSKGGFAALYMGYRGKYGHIIAGGPQVLLGNFLSSGKLEFDFDVGKIPFSHLILKYLSGEISEGSVKWTNNILFNVIKESNKHDPQVFIHVGEREPHKSNHVDPFITFASEMNKENINIDVGDYELHSELAKYFPSYLTEKVNHIINNC